MTALVSVGLQRTPSCWCSAIWSQSSLVGRSPNATNVWKFLFGGPCVPYTWSESLRLGNRKDRIEQTTSTGRYHRIPKRSASGADAFAGPIERVPNSVVAPEAKLATTLYTEH